MSGFRADGWGTPPPLFNFKEVFWDTFWTVTSYTLVALDDLARWIKKVTR